LRLNARRNEADQAIADRLSVQIEQHWGHTEMQKPTSADDDDGPAERSRRLTNSAAGYLT
jgi:hypothetical protein